MNILDALFLGDFARVQALLHTTANLPLDVLLVRLVRSNQLELVREVLRLGADPNAEVKSEGTPLLLAVATARPELVRELLAAGASLTRAVEHRVVTLGDDDHPTPRGTSPMTLLKERLALVREIGSSEEWVELRGACGLSHADIDAAPG